MSRLPERDSREGASKRRFKWRPSNAAIAIVFLIVFTVGPYLAFTGHVPFTSYGYELKATFSNEGNIFIDLSPGSPSASDLSSGDTIPVSHTSTWVQIDQVLTALQAPVRADLSHLLESYGTALTHKPTAAEDKTQLPEVQGKTAAAALNG